jgi:CBS domain-containing protein
MLVREVMTCGVAVVHPDTTLEEAAAKMERFDIGLLPVCADDQLLGTLTDRDITVRSVAHGEDPTEDRVRDVMSREVVHCFEDQDVDEAARLMQEKQIRRLPVLSRDQRLVGIVSLGDLAVEIGDEQLAGETLEQVSEPIGPHTGKRPTAHAQPVDPEAHALQTVAREQPGSEQRRLQDVLPDIKDVAQKVGGMKNLADIAETLDQGKK